ncbi:MAG: helix-turn-helix transcriptional regulator [Clostridia bacterium]|nr:helix-turn-helix transcriptional regulator [Clostridia bacterium]
MLAENLKEARKKKGLSQEDVAKKAGISQQAYSYYENGLKVPTLPTIKVIAETLETSIDDLVK